MSNTFRVTHVEPTLDTKTWWDLLAKGTVSVPSCRSCGGKFFPPQAFCCHCGSAEWSCEPTDGQGQVYSWVVVHRPFSPETADKVPYGIVAVDLREGGRLIGRYLGDPADLKDALPVRAKVFHENEDPLLGFEPVR